MLVFHWSPWRSCFSTSGLKFWEFWNFVFCIYTPFFPHHKWYVTPQKMRDSTMDFTMDLDKPAMAMGNSPMRRLKKTQWLGHQHRGPEDLLIWVWVNTYRYHYYSGLFTSILTQLFWCEQKRGTIGFDTHSHRLWSNPLWNFSDFSPSPVAHRSSIWLPMLHHLPRSWMICHSSSSESSSELEHWFTIKHELILTYRFTEIIDASFVWFAFQFSALCPNLFFWAISQHWLREPVDGI